MDNETAIILKPSEEVLYHFLNIDKETFDNTLQIAHDQMKKREKAQREQGWKMKAKIGYRKK